MTCENCDSTGWVCENHSDRPWDSGESERADVCGCGAGSPCPACIPKGAPPWSVYPIDPDKIVCSVYE